MQETINKMVASVRHGVIQPDHASRSIHECAGMLGLQLAEDIPADTLIVTGMRKTVSWYLDNQAWLEDVTSGQYRQWLDLNYSERA